MALDKSDQVIEPVSHQAAEPDQDRCRSDDDQHGLRVPGPGGHGHPVPAAGGCSASVKAIASIKTPSDAARPASWARGVAVRRSATGETKNRKEQAVPMPRASRCPPHIERTDTYRLEGWTNAMITLEPKPAARAASEMESVNARIANMTTAATAAWAM